MIIYLNCHSICIYTRVLYKVQSILLPLFNPIKHVKALFRKVARRARRPDSTAQSNNLVQSHYTRVWKHSNELLTLAIFSNYKMCAASLMYIR